MVDREDYNEDLKAILSKQIPNYLEVLQSSKHNMSRSDCAIIVADRSE